LDESSIREYMRTTFKGVDTVIASRQNGAPEMAWGDTFFIYDPDRDLPETRRFPFATIVTQDYGDLEDAVTKSIVTGSIGEVTGGDSLSPDVPSASGRAQLCCGPVAAISVRGNSDGYSLGR
jgi:hypothetical protein